jgi:soluble lytic murein transglycosylase-like protein
MLRPRTQSHLSREGDKVFLQRENRQFCHSVKQSRVGSPNGHPPQRLQHIRVSVGCALVALSAISSPAYSQVLEIAPDGTVFRRDGAGAATWEVADPSAAKPEEEAVGPELPVQAITTVGRAQTPSRYAGMVEQAASLAGISPALLSALVWKESRWNAAAVSPKGAIGLTQLMPGTARELGVNPNDPFQNLVGGARYFRQVLDAFDYDVEKALAAYNAGPDRVRKANGVPRIAETQLYVASVINRASTIQSRGEQ